MTTVRATCPSCDDDVEMPIDRLAVRVCVDDDRSTYSFRCPACGLAVAKSAEPDVVDVLVTCGAQMEVWHLPAELFEVHEGPPVSHDDILDLHLALQRPGWEDHLAPQPSSNNDR